MIVMPAAFAHSGTIDRAKLPTIAVKRFIGTALE
jgi:hypothetical protein